MDGVFGTHTPRVRELLATHAAHVEVVVLSSRRSMRGYLSAVVRHGVTTPGVQAAD
jgi:hypothetical protein